MWYMGSAYDIYRVKGGPWNPFFLFYYILTTNFISLYFLYTPTTFHMTPHISTFSYIFGKCYHFLYKIDFNMLISSFMLYDNIVTMRYVYNINIVLSIILISSIILYRNIVVLRYVIKC